MKGEVFNPSLCLVLKAANLYYSQNKPQKEIAKILNVSEPTVSRLLKRAKEQRIVSFIIEEPYAQCLKLEKELKNKYDLKDVIVVPTAEEADAERVKQAVALEGARYVQRIISPSDVLGIAWGGTMYYLIQYLNPCQKTKANFVTLHGSISCCDYELEVQTLVSRMAMAFGGKHYALTWAGLAESSKAIQDLLRKKDVSRVFSWFNRITISISGVGSFYPKADSPLSRLQYLKPEELAELQEKGVYGDLMLRFFDKAGRECESSLKERTLAIEMDDYKKIPCKVIVASGEQKAHTVQALLRGGLVDVLIVDWRLASKIIALA